MELQILIKCTVWSSLFLGLVMLFSCEKEIHIDLPPDNPSLVVEACINNTIPSLNYVFITQTVDYFNPNLNLIGVNDAEVYITEGQISGNDTVFDVNRRIRFSSLQIPEYPSGAYVNSTFVAFAEKVYRLEIFYQGNTVYGFTQIPAPTPIQSHNVEIKGEKDGKPQGFLSFTFFDPPGPSYYRIATTVNKTLFMFGFGEAYQSRRIDDSRIDNQIREYNFNQSYTKGDTVNLYLCRLNAKEYKFWESFSEAENNNGPFATPVQLRSNITGAIGSFTGYNISYDQIFIE